MMKKWLKRAAWVAVCVLIVLFGADLGVRWVSSSEWFRDWTREKASAFLKREVRIKKMSASFMGIKLDGLEIAEAGGFQNGTFLSAGRIRLRADALYLLRGHIRIRSLTVNDARLQLERAPDGRFNWEGLFPASQQVPPSEEKPAAGPLEFSLGQLTVRHFTVAYTDRQTQLQASAADTLFSIRRFAFGQEFGVTFNSTLSYEADGKSASVPVSLKGKGLLAAAGLEKGYVNLTDFSAQYQETLLKLRLQLTNFLRPAVTADLQLKNLSAQSLAQLWPTLPDFAVSAIQVNTQFQADPAAQTVQVDQFSFAMPGVNARFSGQAGYGEKPVYQGQVSFDINLAETARLFPSWEEQYRPAGTLQGSGSWGETGGEAALSLQGGAWRIAHMGEFSGVLAEFSARENAAWNQGNATGSLHGKLNGESFESRLTLVQNPQALDADVSLRAGRVALPPLAQPALAEPADGFVADTSLSVTQKSAWRLPPLNIRADIEVASLDAPYIYGTDLSFQSELTGVTSDLKQTHGRLKLTMGNGEIKDLYHLTNANAVTKVLFLSVNIVGKVFNSMNVFSVLEGLGSGLMDAVGAGPEAQAPDRVVQTVTGPDGQPLQIMVPYTDRKIDGRLVYDKFATQVRFTKGVAEVNDGSFVSDTVSFTLDGTTDFNTGQLDMTVQAAPGKHEADGIMPLTVKVGGTVSDPKGSMSIINSVSSLITQGIGNNFASRSVKKGIGGLFGLFKKDDPASASPSSEQMLPAEAESKPDSVPAEGEAASMAPAQSAE